MQIRVVAYDSCNPVQKSVVMVTVSVVRNTDQPVFEKAEYAINVLDTVAVGKVIGKVKAVDMDEVSNIIAFLTLV